MQTIKFKKEGILFYIHKFMYKKNPQDTCGYKRQLIFSFILIIVTIHASIIRGMLNIFFKEFRESNDNWGLLNHFLWLLASAVCLFLGYELLEIYFDFIWWTQLSFYEIIIHSFIPFLIGLITIVLVLLSLILIGIILYFSCTYSVKFIRWIGTGIGNKMSEYDIDFNPFENVETSQIGVLYISTKEKWCKLIKWT